MKTVTADWVALEDEEDSDVSEEEVTNDAEGDNSFSEQEIFELFWFFFHKKLSRASVFRIHVSQQINSLSNVLTIAKILVVVVLNLLQVGFCSLWEQI